MRAIILAAGVGSRLNKYTQKLPKGMLPFAGKPLLVWQVEALRRAGIQEVVIVTGYRAESIDIDGVTYRHNPEFSSTNMVESLLAAKDLFDDEILVSYADLLIEDHLLKRVIEFSGDIGVVVDTDWQRYWIARYGRAGFDTESLLLDAGGYIKELGVPDVSPDEIDARYVGMLKFTKKGIDKLVEVYESEKMAYSGGKWRNSRSFLNGYLTDLLQAIIDKQQRVEAIRCQGGWLEFDTVDDYETYLNWHQSGELAQFINLEVN